MLGFSEVSRHEVVQRSEKALDGKVNDAQLHTNNMFKELYVPRPIQRIHYIKFYRASGRGSILCCTTVGGLICFFLTLEGFPGVEASFNGAGVRKRFRPRG
jgi:hypothetical protein